MNTVCTDMWTFTCMDRKLLVLASLTLATLGKRTLYTNVVCAVLDTAQRHTFQLHYNMVEHLKNVISCFKWVSSTQAVYVRLLD